MKPRTILGAAISFILMAQLVGCAGFRGSSAQGSPAASPVSVSILSHQGALVVRDYPSLFAAPSLIDLQGLVFGLGSNPRLSDCQQARVLRGGCWLDITDPGNAMLIAAYVEVPCAQTELSAAITAPDEVTITAVDGAVAVPPGFLPSSAPSLKPGECPKGAGAAPMLSLLAIPLSSLPATELTLKVDHVGIQIAEAKTKVDLQRPLNISRNLDARIAEVRAATQLALQDAMTKVPAGKSVGFRAIGTGRWTDTGLGCPVAGQQYSAITAPGFWVMLESSDQPTMALEYHLAGGVEAFCGRVAP